jgi:hypothetical protein
LTSKLAHPEVGIASDASGAIIDAHQKGYGGRISTADHALVWCEHYVGKVANSGAHFVTRPEFVIFDLAARRRYPD